MHVRIGDYALEIFNPRPPARNIEVRLDVPLTARDFACVFAQSYACTEPHRYLWFYDPAALQAGLASLWRNLDLNEKLAADFRRQISQIAPDISFSTYLFTKFHDAESLQVLATELDVRIDRESYEKQLFRYDCRAGDWPNMHPRLRISVDRSLVLDAATIDVTLTYFLKK